MISCTSPPEQKLPPAPVITTAFSDPDVGVGLAKAFENAADGGAQGIEHVRFGPA